MTFSVILVIVILIIAVVSTLSLAGKTDENYVTSTKQNTFRLTAIYIIVILLALVGLAWYITHI
jgi:H+/Cl- antiporter ClcA